MKPLEDAPFRHAPLAPPSAPPRDLRPLKSLGCLGLIVASGLFCVPIFVESLTWPLVVVGGALLVVSLLCPRGPLRVSVAMTALGLLLLPPTERALDGHIEREVRSVRTATRRFHAERGRWPTGFAELSPRRFLHACPRHFHINCLAWSDPARSVARSVPPVLIRYLYPAFARVVYSLESDSARFLD